jgi:hypothetical protein
MKFNRITFYRVMQCPHCKKYHFGWEERSLKGILKVLFGWSKKEIDSRYFGEITLGILDITAYEKSPCVACGG